MYIFSIVNAVCSGDVMSNRVALLHAGCKCMPNQPIRMTKITTTVGWRLHKNVCMWVLIPIRNDYQEDLEFTAHIIYNSYL